MIVTCAYCGPLGLDALEEHGSDAWRLHCAEWHPDLICSGCRNLRPCPDHGAHSDGEACSYPGHPEACGFHHTHGYRGACIDGQDA